MLPKEKEVKDAITHEYPGIWQVSFTHDDTVIVTVFSTPKELPCPVMLSRIIAKVYTPSSYTIEIRVGWRPGRFQILFGSVS